MTNKKNFQKIENKIKSLIKKRDVIYSPKFSKIESVKVTKTIKSTFVSTSNVLQSDLIKRLRLFTGSKYIIPTNTGTAALHISLKSIGLKKNDEVLVPTFTFIGTVNSIRYMDANPHFIDSEKNHPNIDVQKLENYLIENCYKKKNYTYNKKTNRRIFCIIAVHVYGYPVNIKKLKKIAKKNNIYLIEDAAEALGSFIDGKHVGNFGDMSILSFNGNKIITSGGGGSILTNNKKLYNIAKNLANVCKNYDDEFSHNSVGFNYLMPNLNASLCSAQLLNIKKILYEKKKLFLNYNKTFKNQNFLNILKSNNGIANYWYICFVLNNEKSRNLLQIFLKKKGIKTIKPWKLIHEHSFYKRFPKMNLKNAKLINKKILIFPSSLD